MTKMCFNCTKPCTSEDYCYGCKFYVCSECTVDDSPPSGHEAKAHLSTHIDRLEDEVERLEARVEELQYELDEVGGRTRDRDLLLRALGLTDQDFDLLRPKLECGALKGSLS